MSGVERFITRPITRAVARSVVRPDPGPPNLIINGNFVTGVFTPWVGINGAVLSVNASFQIEVENTASTGRASQAITTEIGKTYRLTGDHFPSTAGKTFIVGTTQDSNNLLNSGGISGGSSGTFTDTFTATTTTSHVALTANTSTNGLIAIFDNISVKEEV